MQKVAQHPVRGVVGRGNVGDVQPHLATSPAAPDWLPIEEAPGHDEVLDEILVNLLG
jgi:hypothetical protein